MTCAACQAHVEKAVSKVPGVTGCTVSLLTNSMSVEGNATVDDIIKAVGDAGYGAEPKGGSAGRDNSAARGEDALADRETPVLVKRLVFSAGFLLVLMYFSMGHMMWGWPLPAWFENNHVAMGLVQMILSAIIMLINKKFFISGFKSALRGAPNMDTLVSLGSSVSFVWSVYALFRMTDAQVSGGPEAAAVWMDSFYFESAAMILVLITVGKLLEARSKGRTTDALKALMKLTPQTATVVIDGVEKTVPVTDVKPGDVFILRPGDSVPVDGTVIEGESPVNESALTGESIPVDKQPGSTVSAATVNISGVLKCKATRTGDDTTIAQIIKMVSDAAATKAPIASVADKVSGVFVPVVLGIAAVTLAVWLIIGKPVDYSLARAVSVLVISCPCALGLATPVAIMVGNGVGARNGILFKTSAALEQAGKTQIIALDKTGTVTRGEPELTGVLPAEGISGDELLEKAYSLEKNSEHPLARAINKAAEARGIRPAEVSGFKALPGNGLTAVCEGNVLIAGSVAFIKSEVPVEAEFLKIAEELSDKGMTPLMFAENGKLLGVIAVADRVKEDSKEAVERLGALGIGVVMLTGDNERTAAAIGEEAGIPNVIAGVLPDEKQAVVERLSALGSVAMVGDGINDAPALTAAATGIAIGAGTDVAIDAADIVLVNSTLRDVPALIRLSRATLRNIYENLFWAFIYNLIGIPLAAGCFIALTGWELDPMFGAAAMSLSSFCVVSNALRLNLFKLHSSARDRGQRGKVDENALASLVKEINEIQRRKTMTKTLKIEGMMCHHCEMHAQKALEAIDGVEKAVASHDAGTAVVTLSKDVANDVLKAAVEAEGYKVVSVD